ncbi:MAG: carbamoyl phosphate synthase small subunit [Clostridia bacterium]|nr:carbamoyl phosphate synthase small subunit [Clostridia bacterium]
MSNKIYLVLENGDVFEGKSFGAPISKDQPVIGELVFTTGATGYLETITDPNFCGQTVIQTFPLIGNYGVIDAETIGEKSYLKAYIVREWCEEPSNFRCEGDLSTFLLNLGVPGLYDIDTRALTKIVRDNGVMNAALTTDPNFDAKLLKDYKITAPVAVVSKGETVEYTVENAANKVVILNMGVTRHAEEYLNALGCDVICVPADTKAEEILAMNPNGVVISDGPGDPKDNGAVVEEIKKLVAANVPVLGISLGHQLLALANGADTYKLKYGHRGGNQPSKYLETGRIYVTAQNHGYAVCDKTLPEGAEVIFTNINDGSCEGIRYKNGLSVQFIPSATGGMNATAFIYDEFVKMLKGGKN